MGFFEKYLKDHVGPAFTGTWIEKLLTVWGGAMDVYRDAAIAAVYVSLPELCPDDAVEHHARARLLARIPGESIAALRARVLDAWNFWSNLGPTEDLQDALRLYTGLTSLVIFDQANDDWQAGAVADGDDANGDNASRHVIVVPSHPYVRPPVGPDLVVGPDTLVGISMTATQLSWLRWAYRFHRPANMVGIDVWFCFGSTDANEVLTTHGGDVTRLPLQRTMVGYQSNGVGGATHAMVVGPHMVVGKEYT